MNQSTMDLSQINLEEMIRKYGKEEVVRMMNIIIENGKKLLELQKKLVKLTNEKKIKQKN